MTERRSIQWADRVGACESAELRHAVRASGVVRKIHIDSTTGLFFDIVGLKLGDREVPTDCIYREDSSVTILGEHVVYGGEAIVLKVSNVDMNSHRFVASAIYDVDPTRAAGSGALAFEAGRAAAELPPKEPALKPPINEASCRHCGEPVTAEKHHWGLCPTPRPADRYKR